MRQKAWCGTDANEVQGILASIMAELCGSGVQFLDSGGITGILEVGVLCRTKGNESLYEIPKDKTHKGLVGKE